MTRGLASLALAGLVVALAVAAADAGGIYKCTDADGRERFTSDPSQCPNAERHVLKKRVQKVIDADANRTRAARPAARRAGARNDGMQSMWQSKRPNAERELADVERRLGEMKNVIKGCNRGGEWYKTDAAGIRQHIPCSELREREGELQRKRDELVHYLAEGLEDECRQAGCQPGWVR